MKTKLEYIHLSRPFQIYGLDSYDILEVPFKKNGKPVRTIVEVNEKDKRILMKMTDNVNPSWIEVAEG